MLGELAIERAFGDVRSAEVVKLLRALYARHPDREVPAFPFELRRPAWALESPSSVLQAPSAMRVSTSSRSRGSSETFFIASFSPPIDASSASCTAWCT